MRRVTISLVRSTSGNPFAGQTWWVSPNSNAAQTAARWRAAGRSADADQLAKIAAEPGAAWFGDWNGNVRADVANTIAKARAGGATQSVLVAYRAGLRATCTTTSQGQYRIWIRAFAAGIGESRAAVVLEPDGLPGLTSECHTPQAQRAQLAMFADAVSVLSALPHTAVYLDAGNKGWNPPSAMAQRLIAAGVAKARGISLNVSNFDATANEVGYGKQIIAALGMPDKHMLIDTSRNGRGANGVWCNPAGRGLGHRPTANTGDPAVDAYYWVKTPGESDGNWSGCDQAGTPPSAGTWWPQYALGLAQRAALDG
jgi:endoglucanase